MQNSLNKRAAILNATLDLICEQGFHATPMSQIAHTAGVSAGIIYHYFTSKEELINTLYLEIKRSLVEFTQKHYVGSSNAKENLINLYRFVIEYSILHPKEFIFADLFENSSLITESTRNAGISLDGMLNHILEDALAEKVLKALPFDLLNALNYGALSALIKFEINSGSALNETTMIQALNAIWDMICV